MATEEDKKFDAVLGGFLVNDLRVRAGHLQCPESDVLAAYHERSLLPEEMNSWKEHIAGCARCQAVVSELEATDSIPLQVSEKEEVLPAAAKPVTVAGIDRRAPPTMVPEKSRVTSISRPVRWPWLVPAGALAAGLLIWVAWQENRPAHRQAPAEIKTAKVEPPPAPVLSQPTPSSPSLDKSGGDQVATLYKDQAAISGIASERKMQAGKSLKQMESDSRARLVAPQLPVDRETGARQDAVRDSLAARLPEKKPAPDAKAGVVGAAAETVVVQSANTPAQDQPGQQNIQAPQNSQALQDRPNAQNAPGPYPQGQVEQTRKEKSELSPRLRRAASPPSPAPEPPPPAPSAAFGDTGAPKGLMAVAGASNLNLIVAPNRKIRWRAGPAGRVEFSSDGGASWSRQTSNVLVDLTAGAASSDEDCWIVGRAGTILLTTDAGLHWTIVHSPLQEDLGGVRAFDGLHAIIWNLGNTKAFKTSDGGAAWKPVAWQ